MNLCQSTMVRQNKSKSSVQKRDSPLRPGTREPLKTKKKYWQNKVFLKIHYFVLNKHYIGRILYFFVYIKVYCFIIVYYVCVLLGVKFIL